MKRVFRSARPNETNYLHALIENRFALCCLIEFEPPPAHQIVNVIPRILVSNKFSGESWVETSQFKEIDNSQRFNFTSKGHFNFFLNIILSHCHYQSAT